MASDVSFVEYICSQIIPAGEVSYKKMFGEYMIYCNSKPVITVCDNTAFVKTYPEISSLMEGADLGEPYAGAKPMYIISNIDDGAFMVDLVRAVVPLVPEKKPKKK